MRQGQVALEFLTTYGWAFLVILIMMGTLAYFGVLKPSRLLPDRCSIAPEFECLDFQIKNATKSVKIKLKNNLDEPIIIDSISLSAESATQLACSLLPNKSGTWVGGTTRDFIFSGCNLYAAGIVFGEKGKVSFRLGYYAVRSGSTYSHTVNGEIFTTVV